MIQIVERAKLFLERIAIIDEDGSYTYQQLLDKAMVVASNMLMNRKDLNEARVGFMIPPGFDYVAVQWGIWLAGGIAVPLCVSHPLPEIEYVLQDTEAEIIITDPIFLDKFRSLPTFWDRVLSTKNIEKREYIRPTEIDKNRCAMILYTSGTTSKPKGVVTTHRNIEAQITCLTEAWEWTSNDHILHVLPLHHTHGIINALSCALWSGATCEFLPKFDADMVWDRFIKGGITLFMAVPTVYIKLIEAWEKADQEKQKQMSSACKPMRLMVSGSAALPVHIFEKWKGITGHNLLERYGMTEIGMALSNPYFGERKPGAVGIALPGVTAKLFDESNKPITAEGKSGEIRIKGKNVFKEYWQNPKETNKVFHDGWFCTGDIAVIENGYFRILGRSSVDIIKTGGYKVSALEIEEVLRNHPAITDCCVVGVEDPEWGERVSAAVLLKAHFRITLKELRVWCEEKMASYKIPSRLMILEEMPRNAMGKVTKPAVKELFLNHN